jgi:hypothetical protein
MRMECDTRARLAQEDGMPRDREGTGIICLIRQPQLSMATADGSITFCDAKSTADQR